MILKLILVISLMLIPVSVQSEDTPVTYDLCPGFGCDKG